MFLYQRSNGCVEVPKIVRIDKKALIESEAGYLESCWLTNQKILVCLTVPESYSLIASLDFSGFRVCYHLQGN